MADNYPKLDYEDLPSLDYEEYPRTRTLLQGVEKGLETGTRFAGEQLKRFAIPGVSPEVSKSFVERPLETVGAMAGTLGAAKYPASTILSLLSRKLMETPTGVKGSDVSQQMLRKVPKPLFMSPEPISGAIGAAGQIARATTPKQFREIPKAAAEVLAFKAGERFNKPLIKAVSKLPEHIPVYMGKGYKLQRAEQIAKDVDDIRYGIGDQISEELNTLSPSGGAVKGNLFISDGLDKDMRILDSRIMTKLKKPEYGIKWVGGKIEKTVNNIHKFRQALADQMTGKDWYDATSMTKENVKKMFMISGDYMKKTVPELTGLFDEFSGYMNTVYEPVTNVLYKGQTVVERPIRSIIRKGGEESIQKSIEAVGLMSKTTQRALSDLYKYAGRIASKRAIGKAAGTVGKAALWLGTGGGIYGIGKKMGLLKGRGGQ